MIPVRIPLKTGPIISIRVKYNLLVPMEKQTGGAENANLLKI